VSDVLRYFFDEHMNTAIADQLRMRGVNVLTAQEAGRAGQGIPDSEQLAYATNLGCTFVTKEKREFPVLAYQQIPHAGIIILQRDAGIGDYIEYLEYLAKTTEPEEIESQPPVYYNWT